MSTVTLFRALGDPTRLEIVRRLSSGHFYTINTVSQGLEITRQGVRKHLQILVDSELVTLLSNGRDTTVVLNRKKLEEGKLFIAELEGQWDMRLEKLRKLVEEEGNSNNGSQ